MKALIVLVSSAALISNAMLWYTPGSFLEFIALIWYPQGRTLHTQLLRQPRGPNIGKGS
jgi:hypothetical protein